MGWDAFGMPAENAARQNNLDPKIGQIKNINNEISTKTNSDFLLIGIERYQLVQKNIININNLFFLELYEKGLVYRKENYVNWDPVDQTVLANEQVIDGKGWRSGAMLKEKN